MATYVNVTVGGGELLDRDRQQRQASRFDALEKQKNEELQAEKAKQSEEKQGKALKPLPYQRDPAAHRTPTGGVVGVTYSTSTDNVAARTIKLKVGTPDFGAFVEIRGIYDPGLVLINDVTLPASGNNGVTVEAVGGIHYRDTFYTNPYQAWSGLDIGGRGSPPLLYQGTVPPPMDTSVDTWTPTYDTYSASKSQVLVFPAGGRNCLFVYVHNSLKTFNTFKRIARRRQQSINATPATGYFPPEVSDATWYDMRQTNSTVFEYVNTQTFKAYEVFAVLVTESTATQVTVPQVFLDAIKKLVPPVGINGTISRTLESGGGQISAYVPGNSDSFFTLPTTYQNCPYFDSAIWQASTPYGTVPSGNDVLAKQFGLGWLQYSNHAGRFFSPAVFSYLKGTLSLQGTAPKQYAAMRTQLAGPPPTKYLAPCVKSCNTDDTEFYSTTTTPATTTTPVPAAAFKPERKHLVKRGEISAGTLYYVWDWDNQRFCRLQLAALGFAGLPFK